MWFTANGREPGQDPYFTHLYRIKLDGTGYVSLTPDDGTHTTQISPSGRWVVDTYSRCDLRARRLAARRPDGQAGPRARARRHLEAAGHRLEAADGRSTRRPPTARPTSTACCSVRPTSIRTAKYPIINQIYPGPQSGSVGSRAWTIARGDRQALAELGFIVVSIDGRGTPGRSKAFHDAYYGAMGRDNTIPDQIAGDEGTGHALPVDRHRSHRHLGPLGRRVCDDVRDVPVSGFLEGRHLGVRQSRSAQLRGRLGRAVSGRADGHRRRRGRQLRPEGNQNFAKDLKGKLLLAHGGMDGNVPLSNTMLVVDALVRANKDFELIIFPERRARLRRGRQLHDAAPLGLLRATPAGRHAAAQLRDSRDASRWRAWRRWGACAVGRALRLKGSDRGQTGVRPGSDQRVAVLPDRNSVLFTERRVTGWVGASQRRSGPSFWNAALWRHYELFLRRVLERRTRVVERMRSIEVGSSL